MPSDEELLELYAQAKKRVSNVCLDYAETTDESLFPADIEGVYDPKIVEGLNTFFTDPQYSQRREGLFNPGELAQKHLSHQKEKQLGGKYERRREEGIAFLIKKLR